MNIIGLFFSSGKIMNTLKIVFSNRYTIKWHNYWIIPSLLPQEKCVAVYIYRLSTNKPWLPNTRNIIKYTIKN